MISPMNLVLTHEEAEQVRNALASATPMSGVSYSLDDLFARWRSFIAEIERGYGLTAYDYTNDLGIRDRIADATDQLTPELQSKIIDALRPLDARFDAATETAPQALRDSERTWWRRIPRKRDVEFDETL